MRTALHRLIPILALGPVLVPQASRAQPAAAPAVQPAAAQPAAEPAVAPTAPQPATEPAVPAPPDERITKLIAVLRTDDSFKVRMQAAVFLGRTASPHAIDPLTAALAGDEDYPVRAAAAMALANLGDPRAISHLIRCVASDADPFVRDEAKRALAKFDRQTAQQYVVAAYRLDDPAVRKQVVLYLAEAPSQAGEHILVRALGDNDDIFQVAQNAALQMSPEVRLSFLETALDHREANVRRGAVRVLHDVATPEAAKLILRVYERDIEADAVRNETRIALRDLRRHLPIEQIAKDGASNPDKHARARALKLLGVIGGTEAEKVLVAALADEDVYLRGTAVMALADLNEPALLPALEKLEADPANQRILHLLRHTLKQLRRQGAPTN